MFVIFTYDVNAKRDGKMMKTCRKYLTHVQNSVFEGMLSPSKLKRLKSETARIIDKKTDNICIYEFDSLKYARKEQIGTVRIHDNMIG